MVARAQSQSCAGCHHTSIDADLGNGSTWPASHRFTHVDEFPVGGSFPLSLALQREFLPHRAQVLESFLRSGGTSAPVDTTCENPLPPELVLDCRDPAAHLVSERLYTPSGLEALRPRAHAESLGGARVH